MENKPESQIVGKYIRNIPTLDSSKTALLIIDMINDYLHPEGAYGKQGISNPLVKKIIPPIVKIHAMCKRVSIPIIGITHVAHQLTDGTPADMGLILGPRPFLKYEGLRQNTWGTRIIDEIPECDIIIEKVRLNAFFQTSLEVLLRGLAVDIVLLSGIQTNYCVESTARSAWDLDFQFIVLSDCVTCFDPRLHEASLETLSNLGGVVSSEYIIKQLKNTGRE